MKYTKEEISKIINLKDSKGEVFDVFNLYGSLLLSDYDVPSRHGVFSSHTLAIIYEDFDWCETEEDVHNEFHNSLKEVIMEKLL